MIEPIITLRVKGQDLHASGTYDHGERMVDCISVWSDGEWKVLSQTEGLTGPLTFVAVPSICGEQAVEFLCEDLKKEEAVRIAYQDGWNLPALTAPEAQPQRSQEEKKSR
jgi:hypothetical protein